MDVESTDLLCLQLFSYALLPKGEYLFLPLEEMNQQAFLPIGTPALQWLGQPHTLFTTLTRITVQ